MDSEAVVRIVGDASKVAPAIDKTKSEVADLRESINRLSASMLQMAREITDGMAKSQRSIRETKEEVASLHARQEAGFRGMLAGIHEGVESFNGFKHTLYSIGEAYMAAFAVERIHHWAEAMGEAAERTVHLGQMYGLTVSQVQQLGAVADATGMRIDLLTKGMGFMDKNLAAAEGGSKRAQNAFDQLGISLNDGKSNFEKFAAVADKFAQMADGPKKTALAMQVFGKAGAELIPILNQGRAGLDEFSKAAEDFGAVNERAVERGMALADAMDMNKIAMKGVSNVLMDAFAPALTDAAEAANEMIKELVSSYQSGGAAKDVFDAMVSTMRMVGAAIGGVADVVKFLAENMATLEPIVAAAAAVWVGKYVVSLKEVVFVTAELRTAMTMLMATMAEVGIVEALQIAFISLAAGLRAVAVAAAEATAALLLNPWTWVAVAVAAVVAAMMQETQQTKEQIAAQNDLKRAEEIEAQAKGDLTKMSREAIEVMRTSAQAARDNAEAQLASARGTLAAAQANAILAGQKEVHAVEDAQRKIPQRYIALGGYGPEAAAAARQRQQSDDAVKAAQDTADKELKALGIAQSALDKIDAELKRRPKGGGFDPSFKSAGGGHEKKQGSDHMSEYRTELADKLADEKNFGQDEVQMALKFWTDKLNAEKQGSKEEVEIKREVARLKLQLLQRGYQDEVSVIRAQQTVKADAAKTDTDLARIGLQENLDRLNEEERAGQISAAKAAQIRAGLNAQIYALDLDLENKEYAIQREALRKELALAGTKPERAKQINQQLEVLEKSHLNRMVLLNAEADAKMKRDRASLQQAQMQNLNQMRTAWSQSIAQMLTGQTGFFSTIRSLWGGLQNLVANILQRIVEQWLIQHGVMTAIGKLFGVHDVATSVGRAGAAAYAATAAIPIVGPALAPAAAATAIAGATSAGSIALAEGGDWHVKEGLYGLHKDEMVLPAWAANPLRDMITKRSAANNNSPFAANDGGDGGINVTIHAVDAHSVKRLFMDNRGHLADAMRKHIRDGGR